ncbi:MAG: PocR ligand-binding domain-containing protein [Spirochaetaceae bacterium]|jgi:AraC-like DNA-binding protein/ligand-binding sensor protein|nr:PocR ligand-binding domain-containing protein [Spirochaetaceae bacterium]
MVNDRQAIIFNEEVQRLIDSFAYCFKVRFTVFSVDGEDALMGYPYSLSDYCLLIRKSLGEENACIKQNHYACNRCEQNRKLLLYRCHAGLNEAVMPIICGTDTVGYAMIGQFRMKEKIPQDIIIKWQGKDLDPEILEQTFAKLPFFDEPMVSNMLHLFSMLTEFIVSHDYVNIMPLSLAERLNHWLEKHIMEPVSLDDAAKAMCCSSSTISHTIKKSFGMSFKRFFTLKRIAYFESQIRKDSAQSICQAAEKAGYDDPLYFSRIYKRVRNSTPKEFRDFVRGCEALRPPALQ